MLVLDGSTGAVADRTVRDIPATSATATCWYSTTPRCCRRGCSAAAPVRRARRSAARAAVSPPRARWCRCSASNPVRAGERALERGRPVRLLARRRGSVGGELPEAAGGVLRALRQVCRCRRTSPAPPTRTIASATRACSRARPARWRRPPPACTFDAALLGRWRRAVWLAPGDAARGRRHLSAAARRGARCEHVMPRRVVRGGRGTVETIRQPRADGGRVIAVGTTVARSLEAAAADGLAPGAQRGNRAVHPPRIRVSRGRRAADQLSPAGLDAADAGGRVRRLRTRCSPPTAHAVDATLPLLQLW